MTLTYIPGVSVSNDITFVMYNLLLQFKVDKKLILTLNGESIAFPNSCFKHSRAVE